MKYSNVIALSLVAFLLACNIAGPSYPARDGAKYLRERGYAERTIQALVSGRELGEQELAKISKLSNVDVLFLVAKHPSTKGELLESYVSHSNDFVRSGVGQSPNLSDAQLSKLFQDRSHTVLTGLAKNRYLSEEMLLKLHRERKPGLLWFAMNPKCPEAIAKEIEASSNDIAKTWLKKTRKRHSGIK